MSLNILNAAEVLAQLDTFDTVIDARSESEFALDHLPGAVNWPTLNDEERKLVHFDFKQVRLNPLLRKERIIELRAAISEHVFLHERLGTYMVDGLFTTPGCQASDVRLQFGVSDHAAIVARLSMHASV